MVNLFWSEVVFMHAKLILSEKRNCLTDLGDLMDADKSLNLILREAHIFESSDNLNIRLLLYLLIN